MSHKKNLSLLILITLILFTSCEGGRMPEKAVSFTSIKNIPESTWKKLSKKRIYFGHQSVGYNILDGLKDVIKENPQIKLSIVETHDPAMFNKPVFAHSTIGKNMEPISKIEAFAELMGQGIGGKADLAFFKFCFVDITAGTDVQNIFARYKNRMGNLRGVYPKTTFIHVTVPLTTVQTGPKVWIKKVIGRPIGGYSDNMKRNEFNDILIKEYAGREPILDLAKIESIYPSGKRESFRNDGITYYALVSEYTQDGGHLNENGQRVVAEQFIIFLSDLLEKDN